jgi:hypothetical protein
MSGTTNLTTPERRAAAKVSRQKEIARLALDDILDPVWGDVLAECDLLLPHKIANAVGIRALAAVTFDFSQLGVNEKLLFEKTMEKISAAADAVAVRRQAPRTVPADGTLAFPGEVCEAAEALARVYDRADSEGITAGIAVIGSQRRIELEEEGRACGRIKSKDTTPKFDPVLTQGQLLEVYKFANNNVAMPQEHVCSGAVLEKVYNASLGQSGKLPPFANGLN